MPAVASSIDGAELSLIDTTVDDNVAAAGGGIYAAGGFLTVFGSTISSNRATDLEVGAGGGLYLIDSSAQLTNSTVSGNSATRLAGAMVSLGTELELLSSTLANNSVLSGQPAGTAFYRQPGDDGDGGETGGTIVRNTLMAANPGQDCAGAGPIQTTNSITDDASCPGDDHPDAKLAGLVNNTGPTDTHALLAGSPAIDAGAQLPADRPARHLAAARTGCDVGAYEGCRRRRGRGGAGAWTPPPPMTATSCRRRRPARRSTRCPRAAR